MKTISSTVTVCLAVCFGAILSNPVSAADKPNVVIVITDDQGWGDLSCHGNPILKTPNIDALAADSIRLEDYHVAPTCSPTRCAFLTGHWTDRTGVWHTIMGRSMLRANEVTMGQIFKDGGYATGMFGKWHLGDNYPFRPEDRGYTEVLRHGGGGVGQTPDYWDNAYFGGSYFHNKIPEKVEGFCTDVFFDYAKRFIEDQVEKDQPFLAYIATNAPHGPLHSPPEFSEPYKDQSLGVANFFGMIANIDHNVGELRKWLDEKGLTKNTIFIFTTDNGTATGRKVFMGGMRGAKGSEYDGGHRVPFFIHWPKGGYGGGRKVEQITAHVDVVPTMIDLCGIPAPKGVKFDGVSIKPLLDVAGKKEIDWPNRMLVTDNQRVKDPIKWKQTAVMSNRWRLINGKELYEIKKDPEQKTNVYKEHPEAVTRLTKFYDAWWDELEPTFATAARVVLGNPAENPTRLTCHDWIGEAMPPWNQGHIRDTENSKEVGFWALEVEQAGEYEIELRRWPAEAGLISTAIIDSIPAGADVPGTKAYRARKGKAISATTATIEIAGKTMTAKIVPGAASVTLKTKLGKGPTELTATFKGADGSITGAYYAYIKKL